MGIERCGGGAGRGGAMQDLLVIHSAGDAATDPAVSLYKHHGKKITG